MNPAHYNRTSITSLKIHHPADNKETDSVFYCTVRSNYWFIAFF